MTINPNGIESMKIKDIFEMGQKAAGKAFFDLSF